MLEFFEPAKVPELRGRHRKLTQPKLFRQPVSAAFLGGVVHHQKLVVHLGRQNAGGALRNAKKGPDVPAGDVAAFTEEKCIFTAASRKDELPLLCR
jgi:hypothetical protein